jgi:hypothetical protein
MNQVLYAHMNNKRKRKNKKDTQGTLIVLSTMKGQNEKIPSMNQTTGPHHAPYLSALTLGFPICRMVRNRFPLFVNNPVSGTVLWQPKWTKTLLFQACTETYFLDNAVKSSQVTNKSTRKPGWFLAQFPVKSGFSGNYWQYE